MSQRRSTNSKRSRLRLSGSYDLEQYIFLFSFDCLYNTPSSMVVC